MVQVVQSQALEELYQGGPEGLGSLLLANESATWTMTRLLDDVLAGHMTVVQTCLGAPIHTPEGAAALDGAVRAVGLAAAMGREVDPDLAAALLEAQQPLLARRFTNWPPIPIVSVKEEGQFRGIMTAGAWFLAVLSLTRQLGPERPCSLPPSLNPWTPAKVGAEDERFLVEALSVIGSAFPWEDDTEDSRALQLAAFHLGSLLLELFGVHRRHGAHLLEIQHPDLLVSYAAGNSWGLSKVDARQLLLFRFGVDALQEACDRRAVGFEEVIRFCWRIWQDGQDTVHTAPPIAWLHRRDTESSRWDVRALWRAAPADGLSDDFTRSIMLLDHAWPHLQKEVWERVLEFWHRDGERWSGSGRFFKAIPEELALDAVMRGLLSPWDHEVRLELWGRMPDQLLALVDVMIRQQQKPDPQLQGHGGPVGDLVWSAPPTVQRELVARAQSWVQDTQDFVGGGVWVWRWLIGMVDQRGPAWRDAFRLLEDNRDEVQRALEEDGA